MAYASPAGFPRGLTIPKITPRAKRSAVLCLLTAIAESNHRRAERAIACYLGTHKFTDETEREIERRFLTR